MCHGCMNYFFFVIGLIGMLKLAFIAFTKLGMESVPIKDDKGVVTNVPLDQNSVMLLFLVGVAANTVLLRLAHEGITMTKAIKKQKDAPMNANVRLSDRIGEHKNRAMKMAIAFGVLMIVSIEMVRNGVLNVVDNYIDIKYEEYLKEKTLTPAPTPEALPAENDNSQFTSVEPIYEEFSEEEWEHLFGQDYLDEIEEALERDSEMFDGRNLEFSPAEELKKKGLRSKIRAIEGIDLSDATRVDGGRHLQADYDVNDLFFDLQMKKREI